MLLELRWDCILISPSSTENIKYWKTLESYGLATYHTEVLVYLEEHEIAVARSFFPSSTRKHSCHITISPEKDEISEHDFWAEGLLVECFCLACSGLRFNSQQGKTKVTFRLNAYHFL